MKFLFVNCIAISLFINCTAEAQQLSINKKKIFSWSYYQGEKKVHWKEFNSILRSHPDVRRVMRRRDVNLISASLALTGSLVYSYRALGRGLNGLDTQEAETIRTLCLVAGILAIATTPKLTKAVRVYNNNLAKTNYLKLGGTNHGLGLMYVF